MYTQRVTAIGSDAFLFSGFCIIWIWGEEVTSVGPLPPPTAANLPLWWPVSGRGFLLDHLCPPDQDWGDMNGQPSTLHDMTHVHLVCVHLMCNALIHWSPLDASAPLHTLISKYNKIEQVFQRLKLGPKKLIQWNLQTRNSELQPTCLRNSKITSERGQPPNLPRRWPLFGGFTVTNVIWNVSSGNWEISLYHSSLSPRPPSLYGQERETWGQVPLPWTWIHTYQTTLQILWFAVSSIKIMSWTFYDTVAMYRMLKKKKKKKLVCISFMDEKELCL